MSLRSSLYTGARILGHVEALFRPARWLARIVNIFLGRTIVRRLWR